MTNDTDRGLKLESLLSNSDLVKPIGRAEILLFQALAKGTEVQIDCSSIEPASKANPRSSYGWRSQLQIRGAFVRWVCLQIIRASGSIAPKLIIGGARFIESIVDLSGIRSPIAIEFLSCRFDIEPDFSEAHFSSVHLDRTWVPSLFAKAVVIDGELSMTGFASRGRVSLERASIGGDLNLQRDNQQDEPQLESTLGEERPRCNPDKEDGCNLILNCQNIRVGGSIYLDECVVWGLIDLTGAQIGADFDCGVSELNGLGNASLILEKVNISGQIFFEEGFLSRGEVRINNSIIKNGIYAAGGTFKPTSNSDDVSFRIENSLVSGDTNIAGPGPVCTMYGVSFRNSKFDSLTFQAAVGSYGLDLRDAKAITFVDFPENWPAKGSLHLNGFVYSRILIRVKGKEPVVLADQRLNWLERDTGSPTQPYMQFAKVLQEEGFEDDATMIMEKLKARQYGRSLVGDLMWGIGYGYEPIRVFGYLTALTGLGWVIYRRAHLAKRITPTEKDAYDDYKTLKGLPPHYTKFSPLIYSLENTFPLVNLGQASKWQPDPLAAKKKVNNDSPPLIVGLLNRLRSRFDEGTGFSFLRMFLWLQILLGWILATFFVAGLAGLIHK